VLIRYSRVKSKRSDVTKYLELWVRRIEYLIGGQKVTNQNIIMDVAKELADFFKDLEDDWAPTDIGCGLILLKREQKMVRESLEVQKLIPDKIPQEMLLARWNRRIQSILPLRHNIATPEPKPNEMPIQIDEVQAQAVINIEAMERVRTSPSKSQSSENSTRRISLNETPKKSGHMQVVPRTDSNRSKRNTTLPESNLKREVAFVSSDVRKSTIEDENVQNNSGYFSPEFNNPYSRGWQFIPVPPSARKVSITLLSASVDFKFEDTITRDSICDILHFSHYAEIAYINFDLLDLKRSELVIYTSKKNDLYHIPYIISYDHDWRSIVISMRGTFSAIDVLVDLKIDMVPIEENNPHILAHSGILTSNPGMLNTARNVVANLIKSQILEKYLTGNFQSYRIVVCGHSLGAGVAALVTYLLRKHGRPAICYCYSPPGGLLSEAAAIRFDDFATSVVNGDDIVPRLSRHCMDLLKFDIKRLLKECKLPKYRILHSVLYNSCAGTSRKTRTLVKSRTANSKQSEELDRIRKETQSLPDNWRGKSIPNLSDASKAMPTFMPGKILHLEKIRDFGNRYRQPPPSAVAAHPPPSKNNASFINKGNASLNTLKAHISTGIENVKTQIKKDLKYVYVPKWASRYEFQQILVSKTMISDHLPFQFLKQFEEAPPNVPLRTTS
jgi:Lipase (class 3)